MPIKSVSVKDTQFSHTVSFSQQKILFASKSEPVGLLVICTAGELELYGIDGKWLVPQNYMVYIPSGRQFCFKSLIPSTGSIVSFCNNEVSWLHDGCWVSSFDSFTSQLINYSMKWSNAELRREHHATCFYVVLGEMVAQWFKHERLFWSPYQKNSISLKIIEYTKQQGTGVTMQEVSLHIGLSERTLRRHLQNEVGKNWREFIREIRMNRAMELLRTERKSVTETAFEIGFSSSSAFSSAFQEYVGKTPTEFAKIVTIREHNDSSNKSASIPISEVTGSI